MEDLFKKNIEYALSLGADFIDTRFQSIEETFIDVNNGAVTNCFQGNNSGACVRVIANGSWGFSACNEVNDSKLRTATENAIKIANAKGHVKHPVRLAKVKPSVEKVLLDVREDPRDVSLSEKTDMIVGLNKKISSFDDRVVNIRTQFTDQVEHQIICNSEGTFIDMYLPRTETNFWATCRDGNESQWARNRQSKALGYEFIKIIDLLQQGKDVVQSALDLLVGDVTPPGRQTIIVDPCALGVFIHEAFGHSNEADSVIQRRSFLRGLIGERIASEHVTMWSDPTVKEELGSYPYDDEGTPGVKTCLIEKGILRSYMHSRETAAFYNVNSTGNARAQDYSLPPIVRMNNLCMEPGDWSYEEIIEDTKSGILVEGSRGGMEDPERGGFQFSAQNCYLIREGEIVKPLKDVSVSGMTLEVFKSIDAVADNFYLHPGHCGKGEPGVMQSKGVSDGGPYCRVKDILVGGQMK